jgi:phosphoglycerate dehydrogenase-like enzyme
MSFIKPTLLVSHKVVTEFGSRITAILSGSPRQLDILPFTPGLHVTPAQLETIEAAYYSRDIWEGTVKSAVSHAAGVFWNIVEHAPNLKWLSVFSSGTDHQQYQPPIERGVRLTTGAGAQAEPVAIAGVTGLLALARCLPHWWAAQQRHEWAPLRGADVPPDLRGQTAIIVGVGYIGTMVARLLQALGMKTIGIRRRVSPAEHFDQVLPLSAFDTLLPKCDWLMLACPLAPETRGLINARRLALLPRTAGLVNIARGEILDEAALIDALSNGRLHCAYLDVFTVEPLAPESPLWGLPNVLISPHNAGASAGTYARGVEIFLRNLGCYLAGQALKNEVPRV